MLLEILKDSPKMNCYSICMNLRMRMKWFIPVMMITFQVSDMLYIFFPFYMRQNNCLEEASEDESDGDESINQTFEQNDDQADNDNQNDVQNVGDPNLAPPILDDVTWQEICYGMEDLPFIKENKLLVDAPVNGEPYDFFRMLLDENFLNTVVTETNRYAEEIFCSTNVSVRSRISE